jgi:hypothetical protein
MEKPTVCRSFTTPFMSRLLSALPKIVGDRFEPKACEPTLVVDFRYSAD